MEIKSRGTVVLFRKDKGFAFLRPVKQNAQDIFAHRRQFSNGDWNRIKHGHFFEWDDAKDSKGRPCAKNIKRVV